MNVTDTKLNLALILIMLCSLNACKHAVSPEVVSEVASQITPSQQQAYLEKIYDDDQFARTHMQALEQQYGFQSDSVAIARDKMYRTDLLNIDKVEAYLDAHGHPQKHIHGDKAFGTPMLVIHHSPKGYNHRKKYFKTFYEAFENDLGRMSMYLGRMYYLKFDERMDIAGRYTEEFEIDTLIKSMSLHELLND